MENLACFGKKVGWWDQIARAAKLKFPELFSFAKSSYIMVNSALAHNQLNQLFDLPLSALAFSQLQILRVCLDGLNLDLQNDTWGQIWGSQNFAATKVYKS